MIFKKKAALSGLPLDYHNQAASDLIAAKVASAEPCMICRFGNVELDATIRYLKSVTRSGSPIGKFVNNIESLLWSGDLKRRMYNNAGFFPASDEYLDLFGQRMLQDIGNIDILATWIDREVEVASLLKDTSIVFLHDLEPYFHAQPWTRALAGQTVLVIHPFEESIQSQYQKRQMLFQDQSILPDFTLKTLKSVQSIAGNNSGFQTWFEALDWMCKKVSNTDFDVAIIGAGAYGLPLASHIKKIGKKSIHMGGATQLLFGIKGGRWDGIPFFQDLYNEHWTRPLPSEIPQNYKSVERGCYW
jgi:hypothetical protein